MERASRIDMLLDLLQKEPNDLFLNYAIGIELFAEANLRQAEAQFRRVLELDELYLGAYYQLGKLFEAQHLLGEALFFYKEGLEKAKLKRDNKAINEFGEAIFMVED